MKGVGIGAGYFAKFHYEAWGRLSNVHMSAMAALEEPPARELMSAYSIPSYYEDYREMLDRERPDFVDIITPPSTHLEMVKEAAARGIHVICQKPLAPTFREAEQLVEAADGSGIRLMVHENFRFQPWHRKIKELLVAKRIGRAHHVHFRSRMGDGWGAEAYRPRQPYFREYPQFLVFENGIHFIDTFRYLMGEVTGVYAQLQRLNPLIKGEDKGIICFDFASEGTGLWDANRYNEPNYENPRYTFGEMQIEGTSGVIRLYADGSIGLQSLGDKESTIDYKHQSINFAGDCVYRAQEHFLLCMKTGASFETSGREYLRNIEIQDAVYTSSASGQKVNVGSVSPIE